jgi:hypothetical protein
MIEIILFLVLLSISILLIKRRFEQRADLTKKTQTPAQPAAPSWLSAKFAAMKKDLLSTAVIVGVLIVIVYGAFSIWQDNFSDEIRSVGGTSINLGEIPDWYKIEVWPKEEEFGRISVFSGKHEFQYERCFDRYSIEYYCASVLYGNKAITEGNKRKFSSSLLPLIVVNTGSGGRGPSADLYIAVGGITILEARSYTAGATITGPVSIQSDKPIKEVRIFYASPWEKIKRI